MSALILRNHSHNNITIVENDFIDHYMVSANGEYVKVYLLLLRYQNIPDQLPAIPQMADLLENTEGDILRALKYWEKEGILSLEYNEANDRNLSRRICCKENSCKSSFSYAFCTVGFCSRKIFGQAK